MPLVIVTGFPCSGSSYRSRQLASALEKIQDSLEKESPELPRYSVKIIEPLSVNHPRTVYDNARFEKEARAVAYGNIKRALGRDTIVIADGMNYIKGYRYQLWCEAKAAGTTCCVVRISRHQLDFLIVAGKGIKTFWLMHLGQMQIGTPADRCVAANESRIERQKKTVKSSTVDGLHNQLSETSSGDEPRQGTDDESPYPPELLSNLIYRYEEPSNSARWDKPLFIVPWVDSEPPARGIWTSITGSPAPTLSLETDSKTSATKIGESLPDSNQSPQAPTDTTQRALPVRRVIRPRVQQHQATIQPPATDSNALHALEKRTSEIVSALREFSLKQPSVTAALAACVEKNEGNDDSIAIPVPNSGTPVILPAEVLAASTTDELAGAGSILSLPRLQRLRRQWVSMNRAYVGQGHGRATGGLHVDQTGDAFVRFLNAQFEGVIDG
ncbi:hypothetical protein KEM54_004570 [Ascosphaera aggregata]|nr:hypothetical protein KEM54_004570 [Ascosphaera aggregata]